MQTVYKAPVEANINFVDRETPNTNRYLFLILISQKPAVYK